jgi:hypothetical protein
MGADTGLFARWGCREKPRATRSLEQERAPVNPEQPKPYEWSVLADSWLEIMDLNGKLGIRAPLNALREAANIRCLCSASPLDLFAAHRFLATLLYWKADLVGGVGELRNRLLAGSVPPELLAGIAAQADVFRLLGEGAPFFQDPAVSGHKESCSAGSFFSEFASGSNIAHFHHGDDKEARVCVRCATIGMLRLVPWTQSGGAGKSPSIHNAPPIMLLAEGANLAVTLGLNLVPLSGAAGKPVWSGHFVPTKPDAPIPYLEAMTWNPRRVHLRAVGSPQLCWRCGRKDMPVIGPIAYLKNPNTKSNKNGEKNVPFYWEDPAAFYTKKKPRVPLKSSREASAAEGSDLRVLIGSDDPPVSAVSTENLDHHGWRLVVPCTNPANNKTYDHRVVELEQPTREVLCTLPQALTTRWDEGKGLDGWKRPNHSSVTTGAATFVRSAVGLLTPADWAVLSMAAYRRMHESPGAFDLLTGLYWGLRDTLGRRRPNRGACWLTLKLMAAVPERVREIRSYAHFSPLDTIAVRQASSVRYPRSLPSGNRLEYELRSALDAHLRRRIPTPINWVSLCHGLHELPD